jgi:hypothetical protein
LVVLPALRDAHPVWDVFRLVAAGQWRLGEARFSAVERDGQVDFTGADGRSLGRPFGFTLAQLREELVRELPLRRGWLRVQRPLAAVVEFDLDGTRVAVRLAEDAARTGISVEFLVPRDETGCAAGVGPGHFSL